MPSPRTFIIHEYDIKASIYAYRSGDWKISWGGIAKGAEYGYIADRDYPHARCTALLPPTGATSDDGLASKTHLQHLVPWGWQPNLSHDEDLVSESAASDIVADVVTANGDQNKVTAAAAGLAPPPFPQPGCCKTKDSPCLFNIVSRRHGSIRPCVYAYRLV